MWNAFKGAAIDALGSKKFIVFLASLLAAGAARIGWHVDQSTINYYLGLAAAYLVAQGVADHGKGAAEVYTTNGASSTPTSGAKGGAS